MNSDSKKRKVKVFHVVRVEEVRTKLFAIQADTPKRAEANVQRLFNEGAISVDAESSVTVEYVDCSMDSRSEASKTSDLLLDSQDLEEMGIFEE